MNGSNKQVTQPGFRPDLVEPPLPPAAASRPKDSDDPKNPKLERSDSDEIVRELKLGFFAKLRLKLMSPEEKEAFLIEKINEEKERRRKRDLLNEVSRLTPRSCTCRQNRCNIS